MSDTIRNEEKHIWRERLTSEVSCFNADLSAFTLRLLNAIEQAEAENARLTKMVDWLAELVFDRPCAYACCPFDKHRPTGPDDDDCDKTHIQCWAAAARRAVADAESSEKVPCPACKGKGGAEYEPGLLSYVCEVCGGTGQIEGLAVAAGEE